MSIEFDDLSAELWLNVFSLLGADATILHWTAVSHVCRYWRTVSGDWFEQWLRTQSLGTKFCYFGRTKHELVFLRRQIAAMRRHGVSLTHCMEHTDSRSWFLTRWDWSTPSCYSAKHCGCDTEILSCEELRKPCMLVCASEGSSGRFFGMMAELSEESVCAVKDITRNLSDCWCTSAKERLRRCVRERICLNCSITAGDVFQVLEQGRSTGVTFVKVLGYAGKKPFQAAPWYTGLTNAMCMECVNEADQQGRWNLCPLEYDRERIARWKRTHNSIP